MTGTATGLVAPEPAAPAARTATAAVLGGSGFTGGELLRLLLQHPHFDVVGATSGQHAGKPVFRVHPNLRGATDLRFVGRDALPDADVVFP
jgi:LysW-gamma-L-alpha-aminoadipyl-6-phosphate/LysW-L-glutamyl-5-phosphate reductase